MLFKHRECSFNVNESFATKFHLKKAEFRGNIIASSHDHSNYLTKYHPAKNRNQLGGLHVMLVGLKNDLKVGDTLKVTLQFENAREMAVEAQVREP
jgi:hypothetical protein